MHRGDFAGEDFIGQAQDQKALCLPGRKSSNVSEVKVARDERRSGSKRDGGNPFIARVAQAKIANVVRGVPQPSQQIQRGSRHVRVEEEFHAARAGSGCRDSSLRTELA